MSNVVTHSPSLANHLDTLLRDRPDGKWLKSLSLPVLRQSNGEGEVVEVSSQLHVRPENSEMTASRLAGVLWPALKQHSRSFHGKAASVVVGAADAGPTHSSEIDLMQMLKIDLAQLESRIHQGIAAFGVSVDRVTLYNIRLGASSYNIVTANCDQEPRDWGAYRLWRAKINQEFGINLRLAFEPTIPADVSRRSDQSEIAPSDILRQTADYYVTGRHNPIPRHLNHQVADWRDVPFFSIDDGKTKRPEDLVHVSLKPDGVISLKVAIPIAGSSSAYFTPFEDRFCIGLSAHIDKEGRPSAFRIVPAIAHNTCPLDFLSVNQLASSEPLPLLSRDSRRVQNIRENEPLNAQIRTLFTAAERLIVQRMAIGTSVSIEILGNPDIPRPLSPRYLQAEHVISALQHFAQHLMAQWALNAHFAAPLVVLRPQFRESHLIREMKALFPDLRHSDLYRPERRQQIAEDLKSIGREDMIFEFADAIRASLRQRRVKIISHPKDLIPEDVCRFKYLRSIVGNVNNIQLLSTMIDGLAFSRPWLNRFADTLNTRRGGFSGPWARKLETQIDAANSSAQEYFSLTKSEP